MKGIAFQLIVSSIALVAMGGMVSWHWWKLGSSDRISPGAGWHEISSPRGDGREMMTVSTGKPGTGGGMAPAGTGQGGTVESTTVEALQEVVEVLRSIKAENDELRTQLMETNREVNGMQIQLDGYSDDFIPLKPAPMREGVIDSGNPLLPPKRW